MTTSTLRADASSYTPSSAPAPAPPPAGPRWFTKQQAALAAAAEESIGGTVLAFQISPELKGRRFALFSTPEGVAKYLLHAAREGQWFSAHEVIYAPEQKQATRFAVDIDGAPSAATLENTITTVCAAVKAAAPGKDRALILRSIGGAGVAATQASAHIIFPDLLHDNARDARRFAIKAFGAPIQMQRLGIDVQIYGQRRTMRTIFSSKEGRRFLPPIPISRDMSDEEAFAIVLSTLQTAHQHPKGAAASAKAGKTGKRKRAASAEKEGPPPPPPPESEATTTFLDAFLQNVRLGLRGSSNVAFEVRPDSIYARCSQPGLPCFIGGRGGPHRNNSSYFFLRVPGTLCGLLNTKEFRELGEVPYFCYDHACTGEPSGTLDFCGAFLSTLIAQE